MLHLWFTLFCSYQDAKSDAQKVQKSLRKIGFNAGFTDFGIRCVEGTCKLPFEIRIAAFSLMHPDEAR